MDERNYSINAEDNQFDDGQVDVLSLIEKIQHYLQYETKKVPFNNNLVILDKTHLGTLLKMVSSNLPEELKTARYIIQCNKQLKQEAEAIANDIIRAAEDKMSELVKESEITLRAQEYANNIVDEANQYKEDIQKRTVTYIKNNLSQLEDVLTSLLVEIQKNRKEIE